MSICIAGAGWVTAQGEDLAEVWKAIRAGTPPPVRELQGPAGHGAHVCAAAPAKAADPLARNPRLRRSSAISYFAAAAGMAAMADAGLTDFKNTALVFAIGSGGVIYTRKFYDQIVREEPASPLLFPETVYNAPASHLAALLGITGSTYTLVGDASVGLGALAFGRQLLEMGAADRCLIVGAEEVDWVLCEAYREWRLGGMLLADGAAAVLLAAERGKARLEEITDGVPFFRQSEASASLEAALRRLEGRPASIVSSANGTFIDGAERTAVESVFGAMPAIYPKRSLGDALGASALMQVICAMQVSAEDNEKSVLTAVVGLNHQASAALISAV